MDPSIPSTVSRPRIVARGELLIFGLSEHCRSNAGIPLQWNRFVPYLGTITEQSSPGAFGVISKVDDAGNHDYLCGVEVREFPAHPAEFTRLRIPPQAYAVFEHRDHVSTVAATWRAIWEQGLPEGGFSPADAPSFEYYGPAFDGRTGLGGLEIWIPIRP